MGVLYRPVVGSFWGSWVAIGIWYLWPRGCLWSSLGGTGPFLGGVRPLGRAIGSIWFSSFSKRVSRYLRRPSRALRRALAVFERAVLSSTSS